jgi:hypothetical protein
VSVSLPSFSARAVLAVAAVVLLALCARVAPADADAFGQQFPISSPTHVAPPGGEMQAAFQDVAFNPVTGQYLVVYVATTTATEDDVYGQLLDGAGNKVGPEFRISAVSQEHEEFNPATVGFDSETGRYLVAWDRDETVYVRVLAPNGSSLSGELPISATQDDIETEAIAYSPITHEYMVVWKAFSDGRVYSQRLNQDGAQVGGDDVVVGGSATLNVDDAVDLAYNATSQEYLVVFLAWPDATGEDEEVYGQRLNLAGTEIGTDDFQISEMGPNGNTNFDAAPPSVAWNLVLNQYLVGWHGNDGAPLANNEREVWGQLLAADASKVGAEFRISDMGPDGSGEYGAFRPRIAFDPFSNQYLVAWHGDEVGLGVDEFEIWGQYLAANGTEIGNNDFRISEGPDGDAKLGNNRPALAFNPTATCDYLVTYFSGDPQGNFEGGSTVYGRFATAPPACPVPDVLAPAITGLKVVPNVIASGTKAPAKKKKKPAKASKVKKQAKARYTLSESAAVTFTVERKALGQKVAGKCRKAKKGPKPKGPRCALWVRTGKLLKQQGIAGPNAKGFSAKSIRKRGLEPGAYRIVAVATDAAGNSSTKAVARFRVAKPR